MFVERKPPGMELIDVLDRILDKGTVIDASTRLHLPLENLRKMRTRIVVESIETFNGTSKDWAAKQTARTLLKVVEPSHSQPATSKRDRRSQVRRPKAKSA